MQVQLTFSDIWYNLSEYCNKEIFLHAKRCPVGVTGHLL